MSPSQPRRSPLHVWHSVDETKRFRRPWSTWILQNWGRRSNKERNVVPTSKEIIPIHISLCHTWRDFSMYSRLVFVFHCCFVDFGGRSQLLMMCSYSHAFTFFTTHIWLFHVLWNWGHVGELSIQVYFSVRCASTLDKVWDLIPSDPACESGGECDFSHFPLNQLFLTQILNHIHTPCLRGIISVTLTQFHSV